MSVPIHSRRAEVGLLPAGEELGAQQMSEELVDPCTYTTKRLVNRTVVSCVIQLAVSLGSVGSSRNDGPPSTFVSSCDCGTTGSEPINLFSLRLS